MLVDLSLFRKAVGKMRPQKAVGIDRVQGYWYKRFTILHETIIKYYAGILKTGETPVW
jgi:hypothetical protein